MTDQQNTPLPKIGAPATGALTLAGFANLESLDGVSERQLLALHGVGPKAISILKPALAEAGLRLAD